MRNSPDKEFGLVTSIWEQKQTTVDQEERLKLFRAEDINDRETKLYMGAATINICKIQKIARKGIVVSTITENYLKSFNSSISCPNKKGRKTFLVDMMITDKQFPPIPQETRFRLEVINFQKIQGQKKFTKIFTTQYFVLVKKPLV